MEKVLNRVRPHLISDSNIITVKDIGADMWNVYPLLELACGPHVSFTVMMVWENSRTRLER